MKEVRHIGFTVKMLANLLKREVDKAMLEVFQDEATANHCRIIGYLHCNRNRDVYQRELETHFHIRRSTVTQTLQLMEKNGLVQRVPAENDARQKKLLLTERGVEMHRKGMQCIDHFEEQLCEGITDEELDAFMGTMKKLFDNLGKMGNQE
jgi:DNA-binding MarR family transcriptional regulator